MTIYIDQLKTTNKKSSCCSKFKFCHMMTDNDLEELHAFAMKIGMKRRWFQDHPKHPHYDIIGKNMRTIALHNGAVPLSDEEFGRKLLLAEVSIKESEHEK